MEHSREWARQIFQVVCLVDNLDAALENWTNMVEFDESSLRRGRTESCFRGGEERPCRPGMPGSIWAAWSCGWWSPWTRRETIPIPFAYGRRGRASTTWGSIRSIRRN